MRGGASIAIGRPISYEASSRAPRPPRGTRGSSWGGEAERLKRAALDALGAQEPIDLTGFLARPSTEREPDFVLRAFISAMGQWV